MIEGLQSRPVRHRSVSQYVAVTVGGVAGAALRYEIWSWRASPRWLLLSTFGVNVFGCLVLGASLGYLWGRPAPVARAGLFGMSCGFTTFSLYAFETVTHRGAWNAVAFSVVTPVAALVAMALGVAITRPGTRR